MKNILKISLFLFCINNLNADTQSLLIDNDAFIAGKDAHYTNGVFYTWMSEEDNALGKSFFNNYQTNNAISFSHLIFTPEDKKIKAPVLDDLPYAGYAKANFLLYKSLKNSFHEFGLNIGMVGPSVKAKQIQSNFHKINGATKPEGWKNQLSDQAMAGISYNYANKTEKIKLGLYEFDWTNNIRANLDTFYSGILASTTFRLGNNIHNTFATSGNFIGGNESDLLNFKEQEDFTWNLSLSLFANKVYKYYIIDEAISLGYTLDEMDYVLGQQLSFDVFYNKIQFRFKFKSIVVYDKGDDHSSKNWGGLGIVWKF